MLLRSHSTSSSYKIEICCYLLLQQGRTIAIILLPNRTAEQPVQLLILLGLGHNNEVLDPNTKQVKLCTEELLYVTVGAIIYQTNVIHGIRATIVRKQLHRKSANIWDITRSAASRYVHRCALLPWVTASGKLCLFKIRGELEAG
jgi:hypothetical protein